MTLTKMRQRAVVLLSSAVLLPATLGLTAAHAVSSETPYPYAGAGPYANMLAVGGPQQHVYTGWMSGKIVESDDSGAALRTVTSESSNYLYGFDVDDAGNVYLSLWNSASARPELRKLSPNGDVLWTKELGEMDRRQSLNLSGGLLWTTAQPDVVAVSTATGDEVHRFSPNGWAVEPLPNGNVLVMLQGAPLTEFTPTGTPVRQVTDVSWPIVASGSGDIVSVKNDATPGNPAINSIRMRTASGQSALGIALGTASVNDLAITPAGVVWAIVNRSNVWSLLKLDPRTPDVALTASGAQAQTGLPVTFDASGSFVPFAAPARYEWDLDGDGSFETDSGATGRISHAYASTGVRTVTVRVTAPAGGSATASTPVDVSTASPAGPVGVSINNGAMYTNDPNVTVFMRWPTYAKDAIVSNDGGFFPASQRPVSASLTWTLDSSGPERLPKTIYVRFAGGQSGAETYQDDIILDQTRPVVASATGSTGTTSRISARLGAKKTYRLVLKATDATSGVSKMQVTYRKSRPGTWKAYTKRVRIKSPTAKIFVRVVDRAGNVSGWKRIKVS